MACGGQPRRRALVAAAWRPGQQLPARHAGAVGPGAPVGHCPRSARLRCQPPTGENHRQHDPRPCGRPGGATGASGGGALGCAGRFVGHSGGPGVCAGAPRAGQAAGVARCLCVAAVRSGWLVATRPGCDAQLGRGPPLAHLGGPRFAAIAGAAEAIASIWYTQCCIVARVAALEPAGNRGRGPGHAAQPAPRHASARPTGACFGDCHTTRLECAASPAAAGPGRSEASEHESS